MYLLSRLHYNNQKNDCFHNKFLFKKKEEKKRRSLYQEKDYHQKVVFTWGAICYTSDGTDQGLGKKKATHERMSTYSYCFTAEAGE